MEVQFQSSSSGALTYWVSLRPTPQRYVWIILGTTTALFLAFQLSNTFVVIFVCILVGVVVTVVCTTTVVKESVTLIPAVGLQLERQSLTGGTQTRFLSLDSIKCAIMHEAFTAFGVVFFVGIILKDPNAPTVLVLESLPPKRDDLIRVHTALHDLIEQQTKLSETY